MRPTSTPTQDGVKLGERDRIELDGTPAVSDHHQDRLAGARCRAHQAGERGEGAQSGGTR